MSKFAEPMARLIDELKKLPGIGSKTRAAPRLPHSALERRRRRSLGRGCSRCKSKSASVLDVQQHHGCRSLRLLQQRNSQSAAGMRGGRAHQHRFDRKDETFQRRLPRSARLDFSAAWRGSGATANLKSDAPGERRTSRRSHHRHQSHHRRRSDCDLSLRTTPARRAAR